MSTFDHLQIAPPDAIFHILDRFKSDKSDKKVNLSVGGEHNHGRHSAYGDK